MKNLMLTLLLGSILMVPGFAQKYAYVDTEYILDNIPEYKDAQIQLDDLAAEYQQEIEEKFGEIDKMYKNFQAEAVLMPDDVKKKKEEEIQAKEKEVKDLQKQRFGPDGDLFLKREELVKPIQEKIYNAIEEIAMDDNYAFVFDRAGSLTILYVNARFDISDDVLDKVGAELGTVRREDRVKKEYNPAQSGNSNKGTAPPRGPGGNSPGPVKGKDRK
ncbi:MAG: OmpH family outer membrane protein [Bacteroidetes bacterium]|nr:OmpH family outer membrane protein [Bacteroidota bacterium]